MTEHDDYTFSKFSDVLAEAAYVVAGHGFQQGEFGNVELVDGWNALCYVSPVLMLNLGEPELADRLRRYGRGVEHLVWICETSTGHTYTVDERQSLSDAELIEKYEAAESAHYESMPEHDYL